MNQNDENICINASHYEAVYGAVNVGRIIEVVRRAEQFLEDAIRTDTSWHGMYQGGFENQLSGKTVLELGCGDGLNALVMAAMGANVVANDIALQSSRIIEAAADELGLTNIRSAPGDFLQLSFEPRSFDFVVGKAFLHHLTHDLEVQFIRKIKELLRPDGEARFFEPATNSKLLDTLRWILPVPGRPSSLSRKKFAAWKERDPHPERDNSTDHYVRLGAEYFRDVDVTYIGSIERLCRLMPACEATRRFRRWAHQIEPRLPTRFRKSAARSQLIVCRYPCYEQQAAITSDSPRQEAEEALALGSVSKLTKSAAKRHLTSPLPRHAANSGGEGRVRGQF